MVLIKNKMIVLINNLSIKIFFHTQRAILSIIDVNARAAIMANIAVKTDAAIFITAQHNAIINKTAIIVKTMIKTDNLNSPLKFYIIIMSGFVL